MNAIFTRTALFWLEWMTTASLQLGILVILIALAALVLQRFPARFRYALWLLVLVKIILPPSLCVPWSVGSRLLTPLISTMRSPSSQTFIDQALDPSRDIGKSSVAAEVSGMDWGNSYAGTKDNSAGWLFTLWLGGTAAFLAFVMSRYVLLTGKLRSARIVDEGPLCIELERMGQSLGLERTPRILLSSAVKSPFLFGIFHPRIVLPDDLPAQLDIQQIRAVLTHELVHWKRRDLIVGWAQVLAQAAFWFHPFVWLANARLRHERECACDEEAVAQQGCEPKKYAESLLKVLLAARARGAAALGFLGIFERHSRLHERLEAIMNTKRGTTRHGILRWGLLAILAVLLLPMAPHADSQAVNANAETYIVAFKSSEIGKLQGMKDLLDAFNQNHPSGVKTHHYRTTSAGGIRIGYICVDGPEGLNEILDMLKTSDNLVLVDYVEGTEERLRRLFALPQDPDLSPVQDNATRYPGIIATSPVIGATDVEPETVKEITVTFDRDMSSGMSWTGGGPAFPPIAEGRSGFWRDARTCVLPVQLKDGSYYRVGINSKSHNNFRAVNGYPALPAVIHFTTKGAPVELVRNMRPPVAAALNPLNGATGIDPGIREISVTFDMPMSGGMSWVGGGSEFPECPEGEHIHWSEDKKTCTMPVQLKPDWKYRLYLNSATHINFQNEQGIALEPVFWEFSTGPASQ